MARIAEDTWHALERPLGLTPPRRTLIVLADQTELFNGYATPRPVRHASSCTRWRLPAPVQTSTTGCGSLFTHEFTHIVHLDRSEGWARVARNIFGRTPYAFPNLFLPLWQVEGLATYEESAITGEGRLHAGEFRAIVGEAARQGRLEPIDRVNGGLTDWPAGQGIYAYGLGFHQYLADRFGAESLAALAKATAGRVPYLAAPAFMQVYQRSLGDLWRDYEASLAAAAVAVRPDPSITRLTHQGFSISGPRFDRFGCADCPRGHRLLRRRRRRLSRDLPRGCGRRRAPPPHHPLSRIDDRACAAIGSISTSSSCGETPASTAISTSSRAPTAASVG